MATITFSVGGLSEARTVSAGHLTRFLACYRVLYNDPNLTDAQVFTRWVNNELAGVRTTVRSYENRVAEATANAAQTNIDFS